MNDSPGELPALFPPPQAGQRGRLFLAAGLFLLATVAVLPLDATIAQWFAEAKLPAVLRKLLQLSEFFAHGLGVVLIGILIFQLDPLRRWAAPRVVFIALCSGLLAEAVSFLVTRLRPRAGAVSSVSDMIQGWFVVAGEGKAQSFPSGHAATAVGLALALAALYPRGRWLFYGLALLAMGQRLDEGAHFLSDLTAGAALGCLVAALVLSVGPLAALFTRREAQWRRG